MKRFKRDRCESVSYRETIMPTPPETKRKLVVFDVEGVLIPKRRYLFFEVGRTLGLRQFATMILYGFLYEIGLISLKSALKHVFKVFKGIKQEELVRIFKQVPLMPTVSETFDALRNRGWKTALISSGLPTIVVQDLASTLRADHAIGFDLGINEGTLTGDIWGDVIEYRGKLPVLKRILEAEGLEPKECVVVVDDRNNASMYLSETLNIGYNPDFAIRVKADKVIGGKLEEILSSLGEKPKQQNKKLSKNDVLRESIHASGIAMPILSVYVGLYPVALFILVVTLLYMMSELARMERKSLPFFSFLTHRAATHPELYEFATAPIFFALGILLTLLLFPFPANCAAIAMFALGDSTASIFGKALGKKTLPFNKGKTLEGSVIGFLFAFMAGAFLVSPLKALAGAAVAMAVESMPLPLNDNLVTPLATGLLLTLI
jgi:phosphoserine phosphatase/dolichol kinase